MRQYLFTPGPVPIPKDILQEGAKQPIYFRTQEFSNIILHIKHLLLHLANAPKGSELILLTSSGTGAMEATLLNLFDSNNHAIVINGGGFGQRFVDLCHILQIPHTDVALTKDEAINFQNLSSINADSLLINVHETSTGRLYNLKKVGKFCTKHNLLHIVDAISAFGCEYIDMQKQHIDALIVSSNKALALPPGVAFVILSPKALKRLKDPKTLYFNFKEYINNIQRGQTPFTPAVTILMQLEKQLKKLAKKDLKEELKRRKKLAKYFRKKIQKLPLKLYVKEMANCMSAIEVSDGKKAYEIVEYFQKHYNIILTPSGGELKDKLIRISHMGDMGKKDIKHLIKKLNDFYKENR